MIHSSTRADAETSYLPETYGVGRDLESVIGEIYMRALLDMYGFPT
jgi:hypothetical protein